MSFLIPEPDIDLYKSGFPQDDILHRKPEGARLSRLLEEIDQPMVVTLDGGWGSGKTVFLKYWVGEHSQNRPDTTCVYFDAFANDFRDQPLTGLVAELEARFVGEETTGAKTVRALRRNAGKIALTALRIGTAAATAGLSEGVIAGAGKALDAATDTAMEKGGEAFGDAAEAYLAAEDAQMAAMRAFRAQLDALTEPDDTGLPTKRLIFVVDELDRCRPDYALSVLETIKHFFAIPGVHFVLGTNIEALSASVNARYGLEDRSRAYLTKFVDVALNLPDHSGPQANDERTEVAIFRQCAKACVLSDGLRNEIECHLKWFDPEHRLSLRETRQLTIQAKLIEVAVGRKTTNYHIVLAGLLLLRVARPFDYQLFLEDKLGFQHVESYLKHDRYRLRVSAVWRAFTGAAPHHHEWPYGKEEARREIIGLLNAFSLSGNTP